MHFHPGDRKLVLQPFPNPEDSTLDNLDFRSALHQLLLQPPPVPVPHFCQLLVHALVEIHLHLSKRPPKLGSVPMIQGYKLFDICLCQDRAHRCQFSVTTAD